MQPSEFKMHLLTHIFFSLVAAAVVAFVVVNGD